MGPPGNGGPHALQCDDAPISGKAGSGLRERPSLNLSLLAYRLIRIDQRPLAGRLVSGYGDQIGLSERQEWYLMLALLQARIHRMASRLCRRLPSDDARRHRHDRREIAEVARHDQRRALLRKLAELPDILLADTQLHCLDATAFAERAADSAQALGCSGRDGEDCAGLALRLVDLL